jgi:hypothetical protein
MTMPNPRVLVLAGAMSALTLFSGADAAAQWTPRVGVGYVANAPNQFVGGSIHVLTGLAGGLGLYVDAKVTRPSAADRDNFEPDWTAQFVDDNFGDFSFGDESEYRSINVALMRPVTPELVAYAGAGFTRRSVYVEYLDEQRERGTRGFYWVEDPDAEDEGLNVLVGAFFRIASRVSLQFGVETAPVGATIGASYAFPLGR